jgi:hypothetical protein
VGIGVDFFKTTAVAGLGFVLAATNIIIIIIIIIIIFINMMIISPSCPRHPQAYFTSCGINTAVAVLGFVLAAPLSTSSS